MDGTKQKGLMISRGQRYVGVLTLAFAIFGSAASRQGPSTTDIPSRLTDKEFWRLIEELSEPEGKYPDDNLLSNELLFAQRSSRNWSRTRNRAVCT